MIHFLEVGDFLYFNDIEIIGSAGPARLSKGNIAIDGNKVEVLSLAGNRLSFLIKRRITR